MSDDDLLRRVQALDLNDDYDRALLSVVHALHEQVGRRAHELVFRLMEESKSRAQRGNLYRVLSALGYATNGVEQCLLDEWAATLVSCTYDDLMCAAIVEATCRAEMFFREEAAYTRVSQIAECGATRDWNTPEGVQAKQAARMGMAWLERRIEALAQMASGKLAFTNQQIEQLARADSSGFRRMGIGSDLLCYAEEAVVRSSTSQIQIPGLNNVVECTLAVPHVMGGIRDILHVFWTSGPKEVRHFERAWFGGISAALEYRGR